MKISKKHRIFADEEFDKYEDEIKEIGQEFTSENTSINSSKLPAVFRLVDFKPGTTNLDFGGGKFDNAADYLSQYDVINLVYDPYNRSAEHNAEVIKLIREAGGADTATCSNVLNVIKEPEVRNNVLQNIKKLVKPGGEVYITVYEGTGRGDEGPTKAGYQLNRKTADYLDEIKEVFPDAQRRGKLIVAHPNRSEIKSDVEISREDEIYDFLDECGNYSDYNQKIEDVVDAFNLSYEEAENIVWRWTRRYDFEPEPENIQSARNYGGAYDVDPEAFFTKEEMMEFADDTAVEISRKIGQNVLMEDVYIVDYTRVVVDFRIDDIEDIDLSASFNIDMRRIHKPHDIYKYQPQVIDEVVSQYDSYVDEVSIMSAIGNPYDNIPEPNEPDEQFDDSEEIVVHVDTGITVFDDNDWDYDSDTWSLNPEDRFGNWTSSKYPGFVLAEPWYVREIADTLLSEHLPLDPGHYHLVADLKIYFDIENIQYWPEYSSKYVMDDANSMEDINKSEVVKLRMIPIDT